MGTAGAGGRRANGEGTIRRRGSKWQGRIRLEYPDGSRQQKSVSGATKKEVSLKMREMAQRAAAGQAPTDTACRFSEWFTLWAEGPLRNSTMAQSTKDNYRTLVNIHAVPVLGGLPMSKMKPALLEKVVADVSETRSKSTSRGFFAALSNCFKAAERDGVIGSNPMGRVQRPKGGTSTPRALTPDQIDTLRDTIEGHPLEPLIVCAATLGARRGELLGLKWEDVDWEGGVVNIRRALVRDSSGLHVASTKTERGKRRIPLAEPTVQALFRQRQQQVEAAGYAGEFWREEGFVFTSATGGPLEPRNVSRAYRVLAKKANLPDLGMHALRHSAATLWLSTGKVSVRDVQDLLGHADITTTQVYLAAVPESQKLAVDEVSRMWDRGGGGPVKGRLRGSGAAGGETSPAAPPPGPVSGREAPGK